MANRAQLILNIEVKDETDCAKQTVKSRASWLPATALPGGRRTTVTLTASTFTALTIPTGAKAIVVEFDKEPNDSLINLTLKGITGDTGVKLVPSSAAPKIPLVLPLGSSPSCGITNGEASDQTIEILFL